MQLTQTSQPSYWNLAGSTTASFLLWLLPIFSRMDARQSFVFSSLALGSGIYGVTEARRLEQRGKADGLEKLITSDVAEEWVELESKRRKTVLQQRYGILPQVVEELPALPEAAPEWEPVNPFEHGGTFPIEDLAHTLATATSGTLIIAPSGCGKTRLMQWAIHKAHEHYNGNVDFQIIDCKGEEDGWLGIETSPNDYCLLDDDTAREGWAQLMLMKGQLKRSDTTIPMVGIIDEWNNGVSSLKNSPEVDKAEMQAAVSAGRQIVTKGRSKRLYGWMTTHTPETDSIGMDSATRQSFNIVILARGNKLGLISSVLKNTYRFVDDDSIREKLLTAYQYFMSNGELSLKEKPVALTNLCGDWRLVRLPDYRDPPPPIERTVLNGGDAEPMATATPAPKQSAPTTGNKPAAGQFNERFSPEYLEFINSPAWKAKRAERIKLDTVNGQIICQFCGKPCTKADPAEVDHFRYPPKGSPVQAFIDQPLEDLRTLHRSCHAIKTKRSRK